LTGLIRQVPKNIAEENSQTFNAQDFQSRREQGHLITG